MSPRPGNPVNSAHVRGVSLPVASSYPQPPPPSHAFPIDHLYQKPPQVSSSRSMSTEQAQLGCLAGAEGEIQLGGPRNR